MAASREKAAKTVFVRDEPVDEAALPSASDGRLGELVSEPESPRAVHARSVLDALATAEKGLDGDRLSVSSANGASRPPRSQMCKGRPVRGSIPFQFQATL